MENGTSRAKPIALVTPFSAEWSVRHALDNYLRENGFTEKEYDASYVWVSFWRFTFPFPNPPSRRRAVRLHDLHHVVTGYGTDPTGEAEISMWEFARGLSGLSLFVRAIVIGGGFLGYLHSPRRTHAALRTATPGATLFPLGFSDYDKLFDMSVGELREKLGLPREGIAKQPRRLHSAAPSGAGAPAL